MTRERSTSSRAPRRRILSTEEVVQAAAALAEEGIDKVTMTSVAGKLGVTPMALYLYVDDKAHLLSLLLDSLFDAIGVPPETSGSWDERLRTLHSDVTAALRRYPGLALAMKGDVPRIRNGYLQILLDAGFDAESAGLAYSGFACLTTGVVTLVNDAGKGPKDLDYASWATVPTPDPSYTAIAQAVEAGAGFTRQDYQAFALDVYLDGLRALRMRTTTAGCAGAVVSSESPTT